MNRLTNYKQGRRREPSKKLVETKYMPCSKCDYIYCDECVFQIHTNRLASYEDTGLEPEQVKQLNDAFTNSQKKLEKAFDDLLEYKKLEEQGLLIKLPCKVGDSIYFITQELDIVKGSCRKVIDEYIVTEIRGNKYNPLWYMSSSERCVHRDFHPTAIGKTVFLTREEAEKALEVENE